MSLTVDDKVQENSGAETTASTSHVVTLPAGTTDGNTVLAFLDITGSVPTSTGWVQDKVSTNLYVLRRSEVPASETSWTFTTTVASPCSWYVVEYSNIDPVEPLDASATSTNSVSNGGTLSTGTSSLNAGLSTVAFAAFGATKLAAETHSWSGYTNGFDELAEADPGAGVGGQHLAVAGKYVDGTTGTFESTATFATTGPATAVHGMVVAYRAADAPVVAPLHVFVGPKWGTNGGIMASGSTAPFGGALQPIGTWNTNHLIATGYGRDGGSGLRVVQAGTAAYVMVGSFSSKAACFGFNTRMISATGTVVAAQVGSFAQLLYDSSTNKYGVRAGTTGTVSWQSGTTALNTWVWVDLRVKSSTSTWHAEWRIETATDTYTDQTAAELTGQSINPMQALYLGGNAAQTMTAEFSDILVSPFYVAYPLGPHTVKLLTVDPAGTPSVSGTTTNFSVFTNNGTLGAWNAVNARNAVDEVPPTISAAADGVCQTVTAAADYMQFPMSTYTCSGTEYIAGVRMLAPLWSGAGAGAGDLAIRGHDGTTETSLAAASQITPGSPTAVSGTAPVWRCAMWQQPNGWTQDQLGNAALRVGWAEATPDMGVEALYLEVAIGAAKKSPPANTGEPG